jgi:FtsH-binding integral membrane protein
MPTYQDLGYGGGAAISRDRTHAVFGQVMGLVALTVGCTALGAYITRNTSGRAWIAYFIAAFVCIFALNIASSRGREQLAILFLFGMGLLLGMAIGPVINQYAKADPGVVYQAAGATAAFVLGLGAIGYATRRDLSYWARGLFWALLALILFGLVTIFVSIPHANIIYAVLGLVVFGAYTIFDFNRLRRANQASAVPIAASIFLDIFNVFLFMLQLFGGGGRN